MRNLDLTTLRSFVSVAENGGVTRAAGFLNLTQSAVSMQIKRLEDVLDLQLLDRANRRVSLTAAGEQLLGYARRMVALNDEVMARLTDTGFEGEIVLGVPHDIVYPVVPRVLKRFSTEHPRMKVQLQSSSTVRLHEALRRGKVDIILTTETEVAPGGETLTEMALRWTGAPGGESWRQRPLRLAFCSQCIFRPSVLRRLDAAGIPWEMAVESDDDRSVEAIVSADLAVVALLEDSIPPHLEAVTTAGALPDLGVQKINLYAPAIRDEVRGHLLTLLRQEFAAL